MIPLSVDDMSIEGMDSKGLIEASPVLTKRGRKQTKRLKTGQESSNTRVHRCQNCLQIGYDRRTYKNKPKARRILAPEEQKQARREVRKR